MALIRVPSRRLLQTTTGLLLQLMAFARRREPLLLGMCQNAGSAIWLPAASPLATCAHTYTPRAFLVVHYSAATAPCHEVGRRRRRGHSIRGSALGEGLAPILDAPAALVCCRRCSVLALCCSSPAEPGGGRIADDTKVCGAAKEAAQRDAANAFTGTLSAVRRQHLSRLLCCLPPVLYLLAEEYKIVARSGGGYRAVLELCAEGTPTIMVYAHL